jgi:hypothetical protein
VGAVSQAESNTICLEFAERVRAISPQIVIFKRVTDEQIKQSYEPNGASAGFSEKLA